MRQTEALSRGSRRETRRRAILWIAVLWFGYAVLPWYLNDSAWLTGSALGQGIFAGRPWLLLLLPPALVGTLALLRQNWPAGPAALVLAGALGLILLFGQGFAIDHRGWGLGLLRWLFDSNGPKQVGLGPGALFTALAFLMLVTHGLAAKGYCRGDAFVVSAIGIVAMLILTFVFFPIVRILANGFQDGDGAFAPAEFLRKASDSSIWGLGCITAKVSCGVAWNTLVLAVAVGFGTTVLGMAFALIATRTSFRGKGLLRVLTILPIITPPFVIGLAIILLFGRNGAVTSLLESGLGIPRSRWIYGFPGVFISQLLAFTPIAFLILIGVAQGVSPSLEEASQTLRASRLRTFTTISLPLMRPGIANAFLLGFVESLADFGNPLVLGGNFEVLSTKIFFAVVGAANDPGRASVLAIILLAFTLAAFYAQQRWIGEKVYTTVTGKGDAGLHLPLPTSVAGASYALALPWAFLTAAIYVTILVGAFVKTMGRDYTPTLAHFWTAFGVEYTARGLHFTGSAWDSFLATLKISLVAAPLTAAIGLLTGYLLVRQRFSGQRFFEYMTMLSFAIPGTVVGVSYILAFNVPPIELTGTAIILVICFVFRNMPVGVRAGIAIMSQIDKSLDEASLTLGARSFATLRRVILPLLRPAIVASLVYSFVRAMTAVSAVIFLVTAEYNMATAYIVGRVEAGEFGLAIAYSAVLIVVMMLAILAIQLMVGERRLGRRSPSDVALQGVG